MEVIAPKSVKVHKVWLKKTNSSKIAKLVLGFSPLELKFHKESSRHIKVEEINEEEEIQVEPPRSSIFNRLGALPSRTLIFNHLS